VGIELLERRVARLLAAMLAARAGKVPIGLVEQIVGADARLVGIAPGELAPERDRLAAILRALPQRGSGGIAIGDRQVVALAARRGVQVEDQVHAVRLGPGEQRVDAAEAVLEPAVLAGDGLLLDRQGKQIIVHRQAHRVHAPARHHVDVRLARVVVEPGPVEVRRLLLADQVGDRGADAMLLARSQLAELEHIAFLQHPAAQPHAAQQDFL
ncbi:hypothetical protein QU38_02680, partial [Staphylococcus aureus]